MILGICYMSYQSSPIQSSLNSYHNAIKRCGIDNMTRYDYTDGSSEWSCVDYSKVK
jgi:hypothetical protein